ncbi:MAG: beta-galactosidase [Verrucomicrobia bacterium]|nr:beta-galactosidase [Verrucomicrobiota bacterium]MDE3098876.1 beta-galactosidase [Verrucomicrobiota bacterium]
MSVALADAPALPPRVFPHPHRIRYDSQCLAIDGRDVFIFSGSFHYFRCPEALWPARFQTIKAAGFNTVETYVPWNWSERQMPAGLDDFSKVHLKDLDDWLSMAEHYGFYVIVRPGPYICAEWATGGYPQWLPAKKPRTFPPGEDWLRSDDPVYLAWCKHWYQEVCPVIAKHQITRKRPGAPGVILVQIENEYDYDHFTPDAAKVGQLKALARDARANGIDVPLITCWTRQVRGSADPVLRQVFDCCNFYPRWNVSARLRPEILKLRREQPDAPLATTELQGGWFSKVGGQLSQDQDGFSPAEIQNLSLFAIQMGDTVINYYMLFGGSNFGDWGARGMTTTYDYDAPIREWGGVGKRYQRVWAIGHMLEKYGVRLARAESVECDATTSQKDVTVAERRAQDGSRFFFVRTGQHVERRDGTATLREADGRKIAFHYNLEPFGSKIFYLPPDATSATQGRWLPEPAPAITSLERPENAPAAVTITSARMQADPGPRRWTKLAPHETLAEAGDYGSGFVFYRLNLSNPTATNLMVEFPHGDAVLAEVNGKPVAGVSTASRAAFELPPGRSRVELLYEDRGFVNVGSGMDKPGGISSAQWIGTSRIVGTPITGWKMHLVHGTAKRPEVKTDFDDSAWPDADVHAVDGNQLQPGETAVFRASVTMTQYQLHSSKWDLNFGRIHDAGWVYVNGASVGKTTDWSQPWSFGVTKHLRPGANEIAVIVHNDTGAGGLGAPTIAPEWKGPSAALPAFGEPLGNQKGWWRPDFNDRKWKTTLTGNAPAQTNLLTWYRMDFRLPAPETGMAWRLRLYSAGNGFIYLNGHALGRYWQAGPQHDFYLPECWLNFGETRTNVVAVSLRPLDQGTEIQSAVVATFATDPL